MQFIEAMLVKERGRRNGRMRQVTADLQEAKALLESLA
jgi:hypothetical protein